MAYEFKLPDLGEGLTEGEIARWLVSEGQEIAEDDPLVEIQTDKTTVEIPSPAAGKVTRILVDEGNVVPVGTVLVVIGGEADGSQPRVEEQQSKRGEKGRATPLVRKIAQELGVDVDSLTGTGPQGRITEEDVRAAAGPREGRREPLRGVRRLIAEHMSRAHREVPAVTWVEECDFSGVDLGLLVATTLKACAESLKEFPELNARLEGDEIVYLDRYDLGVAVQTEQGLVVPVVRDCDTRSVDPPDADRQSPGGGDPQYRQDRGAPRRARRQGRRRPDGLRLAHLRPPRRRRSARGRVRSRGDQTSRVRLCLDRRLG